MNTAEKISALEEEMYKAEIEKQMRQEEEEEAMWRHNPYTGERTQYLGRPKKKDFFRPDGFSMDEYS